MASAFVEGILPDPHDQDCERDDDQIILISRNEERVRLEDKRLLLMIRMIIGTMIKMIIRLMIRKVGGRWCRLLRKVSRNEGGSLILAPLHQDDNHKNH